MRCLGRRDEARWTIKISKRLGARASIAHACVLRRVTKLRIAWIDANHLIEILGKRDGELPAPAANIKRERTTRSDRCEQANKRLRIAGPEARITLAASFEIVLSSSAHRPSSWRMSAIETWLRIRGTPFRPKRVAHAALAERRSVRVSLYAERGLRRRGRLMSSPHARLFPLLSFDEEVPCHSETSQLY